STVPTSEQAPRWQQTPIADEGLDYDDLAETKAVDREQHSPAPVAATAPSAGPTPAPMAMPMAGPTPAPMAGPAVARPVHAAPVKKKKSKLGAILVVLGLVGACLVFSAL